MTVAVDGSASSGSVRAESNKSVGTAKRTAPPDSAGPQARGMTPTAERTEPVASSSTGNPASATAPGETGPDDGAGPSAVTARSTAADERSEPVGPRLQPQKPPVHTGRAAVAVRAVRPVRPDARNIGTEPGSLSRDADDETSGQRATESMLIGTATPAAPPPAAGRPPAVGRPPAAPPPPASMPAAPAAASASSAATPPIAAPKSGPPPTPDHARATRGAVRPPVPDPVSPSAPPPPPVTPMPGVSGRAKVIVHWSATLNSQDIKRPRADDGRVGVDASDAAARDARAAGAPASSAPAASAAASASGPGSAVRDVTASDTAAGGAIGAGQTTRDAAGKAASASSGVRGPERPGAVGRARVTPTRRADAAMGRARADAAARDSGGAEVARPAGKATEKSAQESAERAAREQRVAQARATREQRGHAPDEQRARDGARAAAPAEELRAEPPRTERPRTEPPRTERPGTEQPGTEQPLAVAGSDRGGRRRVATVTGAVVAVIVIAVVAIVFTVKANSHSTTLPIAPAPKIDPPGPVLDGFNTSAALPTTAGLAAALAGPLADRRLGSHVTVAVRDVATGRLLYSHGASSPTTPASSMKLATATALLALRGPSFRITTRVVAGAQPGEVVLVGAGDPTLAAGPRSTYPESGRLDVLADEVKRALGGVAPTRVIIDTTLFSGPATGPGWDQSDADSTYVHPIYALSTDGGRVHPSKTGNSERYPNSALAAGQIFAKLLGLPATAVAKGQAPRPASGASGTAPGAELASVQSAPLVRILDTMLTKSDNVLAEFMARQVAIAVHRPASFAGAAAAVTAELAELGLPTAGTHIVDGSGISHQDRLTPALLTALLSYDAQPDHSRFHPIFSGLPIAGWSGTLAGRFNAPTTRPAAGVLRAKTGTLDGVSALAGTVVDASGRSLAFAVMADKVPIGLNAPLAEDAIGVALYRCGCTG